jgi:predicted tellurium resistance membrane protein TerC
VEHEFATGVNPATLRVAMIIAAATEAVSATVTRNMFDMSWLGQPEAWIALLTLTVMEIVLGIDNIVFISILVDKLPEAQRPRARFLGLALAMVTRIMLLFSITWVMGLTKDLFNVLGQGISGKDLILILGGLFLIWKSTKEIHEKMEGDPQHAISGVAKATFGAILVQIAFLDIVFSLDSVITAVGMAKQIMVMVIAVIIAVVFMMIFAGPVSSFVSKHPTVKMLALSFLLLIGTTLIGEGMGFHIPKGYVYFAMAFSVFVEMLNLRMKKKRALA